MYSEDGGRVIDTYNLCIIKLFECSISVQICRLFSISTCWEGKKKNILKAEAFQCHLHFEKFKSLLNISIEKLLRSPQTHFNFITAH